ncbi:hypothetical protein BDZ88DRAFT_301724 [Geranomyces variabilis]|nr:hypothetical protein BDZ88DRAFT_301724 [Geranomyces variabilis]
MYVTRKIAFSGTPYSISKVLLFIHGIYDFAFVDESALRILESFISPTAYPPPYLLDKVISILLSSHNNRRQKQPPPPVQTQIHAISILNLVITLHGSEPFRAVFIEQDAAESRFWELLRQACGFWEEAGQMGDDKEVGEDKVMVEDDKDVELVLAGPTIRFLLDVVGHDLAVQYHSGNIKKSILATSLGRYRKADFRAPLDVMSEMVESAALEDDAIPLVAALIFEVKSRLALLAMAGNSDLTSFLRDLLPNLKALTPDDLQQLLSCIPSNSLRWTLTEMLLRNLCTFAKKAPALQFASSDAVLDTTVALAFLTATPLNKDDWTSVTLLVTQLVGAVDVGGKDDEDEEQRHNALRDAVKKFLAQVPKRYLKVAVARTLEDAVEMGCAVSHARAE